MAFDDITIPAGLGGLNLLKATDKIPPTDLKESINITVQDQTWKKIEGATKINNTVLTNAPKVRALHDFDYGNAVRVAYTGDGKIVKFDATGISATLKTGLTDTKGEGFFVEALGDGDGKELFLFNKKDIPQVWDGSAGSTVDIGGVQLGSSNISFTASTKVIAHATLDWTTVGYLANQTIVVDNTSSNDGLYTIASIGGTGNKEITVNETLVDESNTSAKVSWGIPSDWFGTNAMPEAGVMHGGKLWVWGCATQPDNIYYSTSAVDSSIPQRGHEDFNNLGSGILSVFPGQGVRVSGAVSFLGRLFIFKYPEGIYWLDDSAVSSTNWSVKLLTTDVGTESHSVYIDVGKDLLFYGSDDYIHGLAGVESFGDARASRIYPERLRGLLSSVVDKTERKQFRASYNSDVQEGYFSVVGSGSTDNDRILTINIRDRKKPTFHWNERDTAVSMALTTDAAGNRKIMLGDNAGFIRTLEDGTFNKDSSAYNASFETHPIPVVRKGTRRINLKEIEILYEADANRKCFITVKRDGIANPAIEIDMSIESAVLGAFELDSDKLGGSEMRSTRKRIHGDCQRVAVAGQNSNLDEGFSITDIILYVEEGSDRVR